ncbi:MAG: FAD:protein FMN transferase [Gemmatimonadales bacterium]
MVRLAVMAMGTRFELVARGDDPARLTAAGEAALERVEETHRWLTRFEGSSLLAHLQRVAPRPVVVDGPTVTLFAEARTISEASGGAFAPVISGDWSQVTIDPERQELALDHPGVGFDFGAIAKGHAVDLAVGVLREHHVPAAFVHGGTSSGSGYGHPGWPIALGPEADAPVVSLDGTGFAVSDTHQWRGDHRAPHLVDPAAGQPVAVPRRIVVVGPTARAADGWATAVAVLGARPARMPSGYLTWVKAGETPWRVMTDQ